MIAQVVPVTRLRRPTSWWSYRIPANLECSAGSLVVVPFRGRNTLGVVWEIVKEEEKASMSLEAVITATPLVRRPHRQFIEWLAEMGICSLSTALFVWLPRPLRTWPLTKPTLSVLNQWDGWQKTETLPENGQVATLLPGIRPQTIRAILQQGGSDLFAEQSPQQELAEWVAIARGIRRVAVGRERCLFAPWLNLKQITLFEPEDISYYHEQMPYVHMTEAAAALAGCFKARFSVRSKLPNAVVSALWQDAAHEEKENLPPLTLIDLQREPLLNPTLLETIQHTLAANQEVLILYNAHDRIVQTEDGRVVLPGIQTLRKQLAARLGRSELPPGLHLDTRSLFTTTYQRVGLTVVLSLDPLLRQSSFADQLHGWADLGHLFAYEAPCIIQSHQADHPLVQALRNRRFTEYCLQVIEEQRQHGYTPFAETISCSAPADVTTPTPQEVYDLIIASQAEQWKVSHPAPTLIRKKESISLFLHAPLGTRLPQATRAILGSLPRPWKVQRNPWFTL